MIGWIFRMAWRDSRGSRRRLVLYVASMVLGVASLVAINSFGDNLRRAVDDQARTLLGADLSMESGRPFPDSIETIIAGLGGEQSRRTSFASMALFTGSGLTRLATVRAIEGDFPWYGSVETEPAEAASWYRQRGEALVDKTLMQQFDLGVGDSVRIGRRAYAISGRILSTPRESAAIALFSPRIYVPREGLDESLLDLGSRADYEVYFRFDDGRDVDALVDTLGPRLRAARIGFDTVSEERDNWDRALTNLYRFLGLVGFAALLLGSLGVASAILVYVRQRIDTVAVLRCFGASARATTGIYLVQALAMGVIGAVAGALLGVGVQIALPRVLGDFIPVDVTVAISWPSVFLGMGTGVAVTFLFALMPLLKVRSVTPLRAIRSSVESVESQGFDGFTWSVRALVALGIVLFAVVQAPSVQFGLGYALAIAVVFLALAVVARSLVTIARRAVPVAAPYLVRQGIANLHRPNNQTLLLMLALGLGSFLIGTMVVTEQTLLRQVQLTGEGASPNLVFFDIQSDQARGVRTVVEDMGIPVLDEVPIVTMRLAAVRGRSVDDIVSDSSSSSRWAFRREYRSTYRDALTSSEILVAGTLGPAGMEGAGLPLVSAGMDIAEDLGIGIGDTLVWNVQGAPIETVVGSLREIDWRRMQTNFFFVFPTGVLERAPQFTVLLVRAPNDSTSAAVQQKVVGDYPNVSAIDISLVLDVFQAIFSRIAFIVRFMALFSILTGFIVLSGAVVASRVQRIEETVLLKTLGASRKQILRIMLVEYSTLGILAAATGLVLSLGGGWVLARFVFDTRLSASGIQLGMIVIGIVAVVVTIGAVSSRGVYRRQALEVLRAET